MVHVSQKIRMQNLQIVKNLIAKTGDKGARDKYLVAILCTNYGFHRRTVREYLRDLQDADRIFYDAKAGVWKLATEESKK